MQASTNNSLCKRSSTLDRTNTSIHKSAMIMASILNESRNESVLLPSKRTVHCQHQQNRIEIAKGIKLALSPTKLVVHWDDKLLPDMSDKETLVDRLPVLLSSIADGTTKLLGIPTLNSGTGHASSDAAY